MSSTGLPKTVLSSPTQSESQASELSTTSLNSELVHLKFEHSFDQCLLQMQRDAHNKRMKLLRKELDYIQVTAWKYPVIDKYIGQ
ncbi:Uncharacterized protein GBIM_04639 [Gryllus bimaculatus]|nr:Uncharacterized protein GBIM_04639 [Gryllus bimaculatus]